MSWDQNKAAPLTRAQFDAKPQRWGGDFWNTDMIFITAFRDLKVDRVDSIDYRGTGLWVDVKVTLTDGRQIKRRLYA